MRYHRDPVEGMEVAQRIRRQIRRHALQHNRLTLQKLIGAPRQSVKVVLRQIPREVMEEQAAAKGDVQFFQLAYLAASELHR